MTQGRPTAPVTPPAPVPVPVIGRESAAAERVTREDLVLFVNACFACTGQSEFYGDAAGQGIAIRFLHEYILGNYRRLYARTLATGINHYNRVLIVQNLLAAGAPAEPAARVEEGELILATLLALPAPRAYQVLREVRSRRVNNRRTRAVIREFLRRRPDPVFDAVKYRVHVRAVAAHAHLRLPGEIGRFVFEGDVAQGGLRDAAVRVVPARPLQPGVAVRPAVHHRGGAGEKARGAAGQVPCSHRAADDVFGKADLAGGSGAGRGGADRDRSDAGAADPAV